MRKSICGIVIGLLMFFCFGMLDYNQVLAKEPGKNNYNVNKVYE